MTGHEDPGIDGRLHGEQFEPEGKDNLLVRLLFMLIIALMLSIAQTVLSVTTIIQYIIMLVSKGKPNERLADRRERGQTLALDRPGLIFP